MRHLALQRPAGHPLCEVVQAAGWTPLPCACTRTAATGEPPPEDPGAFDAALLLSPAGARAALPFLPEGLTCLATGRGSAEPLEAEGLRVLRPGEARAEALWELLQERYPGGGRFLLVRGTRSRGFLERAAAGSAWELHPWITHREEALDPMPPLPACEALLALSPLQAERLGPASGARMRLAWGEGAAAAFAAVGYPALAFCEARPDALLRLLASL